jgi:hypothetical protein
MDELIAFVEIALSRLQAWTRLEYVTTTLRGVITRIKDGQARVGLPAMEGVPLELLSDPRIGYRHELYFKTKNIQHGISEKKWLHKGNWVIRIEDCHTGYMIMTIRWRHNPLEIP